MGVLVEIEMAPDIPRFLVSTIGRIRDYGSVEGSWDKKLGPFDNYQV